MRKKLAIAAALVLALLVLPVAGTLSSLWWMLVHPEGTAWLLAHVPTVKVSGAKGALLGDFEAERVEFDARPDGLHLVLSGFGWRGLSFSSAGGWRQWKLTFDELRASRVDLDLAPSKTALKAPHDLLLPLEVEVKSLRVGALYSNKIGEKPLRELSAQLHLGAEAGQLHRVDALTGAWDRLRASGSARIGTQAPLPLQAALDLAQDAAAAVPAWNLKASLAGPLEAPALTATLRAQPTATASAKMALAPQSLDAQATLRPFAPWPLGDLKLNAKALDLAAFHSAAPTTALDLDALAKTQGLNQPVVVTLALANRAAGRWNEGRLPLRRITLDLRGRPDDTGTLDLHTLDAELGDMKQSAGRLQGSGRWTQDKWTLASTLTALQPALLDSRAPLMQFSGPVTLAGSGFSGASLDAAKLDLKATLAGRLAKSGPARAVQLGVDATLGARSIELRSAEASAGGARATLKGAATRSANDAPWRVVGNTSLVEFDPAPWWPGTDHPAWRKGPHQLNASGEFDLTLPRGAEAKPLAARLALLRGRADLKMTRSLLAGVALDGDVKLRSSNNDSGPVTATLNLDVAGNTVHADGRLSPTGTGADDAWDLKIAAGSLERLAPLWRLVQPNANAGAKLEGAPAGSLNATAQLKGRWPAVTTQGQLDANALRLAGAAVQRAEARWQMGTALTDAIDAQATLTQAVYAGVSVESLRLDLKGSGRAHRLDLRAESKSLPPAWTDSLQGPVPVAAPAGSASASVAASTPASTPTPSNPTASTAASRTIALLQAQGGITDSPETPFAGWRGTLAQLELRGNAANAAPWVRTRDVGIAVQWAGAAQATVQPGRAELLGAALRWSRIAWQAAPAAGEPAQIDVDADLEPIAVAPLLVRLQPDFGWGGDLAVGGHIKLRSAPTFSADVVLERSRGDLSVTDETGTQALELTDLRLALNADNGTWNFTQALAGKTLGQVAGAVVARTSARATWPAPETPIEGVLELQVANLGTWGTWVPAGWRLGGALRTSATIGGRFGAPEYTGVVRGTGLSVRNFLLGVNVSEGDVAIALQGSTARIERFTARGGAGSVTLAGDASLGATPRAQLKLTADKFQLLGRVDRRIVTSGSAQVVLDRSNLALDGQFGIDEGLIDFTRSDAPGLADDVEVVRAKPVEAAPTAPKAPNANARSVALNLKVDLGDKLRLRGRGIDTGLRGELRLAAPGGRLAINGSVNTTNGTYAAYGQKLSIDRGLIAFSGVADNPRLDIEATRPNLDTRVGVMITGTAQNPRIRLFSEPEVSDIDKLSWLVLGRASDGLGRADTALLQQAAVALLSGEGEGVTDQFTKAIGLDAVSLRQSDGDVRETVISLGKQLSRRWYVGYERGLNATTGTWQLIYRAAQRFTLRAQSGLDNSLDVIWTWRWQ